MFYIVFIFFLLFILYLCSMKISVSSPIISNDRKSNIELLRIVSMMLVLVTHACYVSLGPPTFSDISTSLCSSILRGLSESMSDVCVNSFILISGWFGIKCRLNRFLELIFQVLFINIVIYILFKTLGIINSYNLQNWLDLFLFRNGAYWFVKAYIVLFILSPVLNAFVEHSGKRQLEYFLLSFYLIQTIYGFYINVGWFSGGYSPLSFIGLYLIARYIKLYPNRFTRLNKYADILLYFFVSLLTAICSLSMTYWWGKVGTVLFQNSSPFIVVSSVYFFLFFTKISFSSRFVNWISVSCFAAYIVHCSPFIFYPFYVDVIKSWFITETSTLFLLNTLGIIVVFFVVSILFDKVRIMTWSLMRRIFACVSLK